MFGAVQYVSRIDRFWSIPWHTRQSTDILYRYTYNATFLIKSFAPIHALIIIYLTAKYTRVSSDIIAMHSIVPLQQPPPIYSMSHNLQTDLYWCTRHPCTIISTAVKTSSIGTFIKQTFQYEGINYRERLFIIFIQNFGLRFILKKKKIFHKNNLHRGMYWYMLRSIGYRSRPVTSWFPNWHYFFVFWFY